MNVKKIMIIGTGGTIAGTGNGASALTEYRAGSIGVQELMQAVPTLEGYGPFESIQFSNIDSSEMSPYRWVRLALLVNEVAERDDIGGIVITHGTDTMEETAYFLQLTVHTKKPVVMTGSMRPATALSADGPVNLLQAVQVARSESAKGQGVLVVMNGYIDSAREVAKLHTTDVGTFGNAQLGHMGCVQNGRGYLYYAPCRTHTKDSEFILREEVELPPIGIVNLYAGLDLDVIDFIAQRSKGLIIGGFGHGTLPQSVREVLKKITIPKVRSSRIGNGIVSSNSSDAKEGLIVSDSLSPVKARILLMLALQRERSREDLERIFASY
ncbi:asparaginase [Veillonella sp. CHU740]|uniref:asparaginase n=1 Tax=Veillonella sp. CHU740 TaxID=2490950 RepID=UPI000F8DB3E4|nr:asparaginase [Veillonella sp. CHU740]